MDGSEGANIGREEKVGKWEKWKTGGGGGGGDCVRERWIK